MEERQKRNGIKSRKRMRRKRRRLFLRAAALAVLLIVSVSAVIGIRIGNRVRETNRQIQAENLKIEREKKKVEVTLSMVGDVLPHQPVLKSGEKEDGSYNFDHLFQNIREKMKDTDISIVNQEVILGGTELGISTYPSFNAPQELGDALVEAGFNTVLHATNHTMDKGEKAADRTIAFWKEKHPEMTVIGLNNSQEEQDTIYVYEKKGFKIAILNYTYGLNGMTLPEDRPYLVNLMDRERMASDIAKAEELADFTVVCPHWGTEYVFEATEEQEEWTQFFLEQGVDLVIGTHPHVIEPVEWVEDGEHKMLVYYSLGNYTSRQDKWYCMVGAMANVTLLKDADGNVTVTDYGVEPLVTHIDTKSDYTTYYLKDYTEELAKKNKILDKDSRFTLEKCRDLCQEVFGGLYQPI